GRATAEYLAAARAVRATPEQIVVTAGTQQAVDIAIRVLLDPGDLVWVEDPGYAMTHAALTAAGVRCRPIPVDRDGLDVAAGIAPAPPARAGVLAPLPPIP